MYIVVVFLNELINKINSDTLLSHLLVLFCGSFEGPSIEWLEYQIYEKYVVYSHTLKPGS